MPVYKAFILNKEIILNYENNQREKLIETVNTINSKLKSYDNLNGKISDNKLLCFLAIKLQAELLELKEYEKKETEFEKKFEDFNNKNIQLNDKLYELGEKNKLLDKENKSLNQELIKIESQIEMIISLVKQTYEE